MRQILFLSTLLLASAAAAQPTVLTNAAGRNTAQETFNAMRQQLEPEVGFKLETAWTAVDQDFRPSCGKSAATLEGSRVKAALHDGYREDRYADRGLEWDWRTGKGQVRINHKKSDSTSLRLARIRSGGQLLVTRRQSDGAGISLEAVRVTREQGQVSPTLARALGAWRLPWQRNGLVGELPREVRQALTRPGASFTVVTCQTRSSEQPQPSLLRGSRPPSKVTRNVGHRLVVGNMNAPLSAAGARELRSR